MTARVNLNLLSLLKPLKLGFLRASERLGFSSLVLESRWRQQRLLILGYHGIALEDEHLWNPSLYMHPDLLRQRLQVLRDKRCTVLPLGEAITRLSLGTLPKRSVALTFDDGWFDFYRLTHPILQEFGVPATLSLTTYYLNFNRPVFDPMCSYLLWKGRGQILEWPDLLTGPLLLDAAGCGYAETKLRALARKQELSGKDKDELLSQLAGKLGIDYEALCAKRILHLINRQEARELARDGVDLQLHTHRHRAPAQHELFEQEINENRQSIRLLSPSQPTHFCYPSGVHRPEFLPWLRNQNIVLATTCRPGLASRGLDPLLLPRLIDTSALESSVFRGWVTGVASLLPRRRHVMSDCPFIETLRKRAPVHLTLPAKTKPLWRELPEN